MDKKTIVIKNPPKTWWPGNPEVEPYMDKIDEAIKRHLPWPSQEYTDIYNRAYEAIDKALQKNIKE